MREVRLVSKVITLNEAMRYIKDGMTIMVGGFMGVGTPENLIDAIVDKGIKNLTIIANDTAFPDKGVGKLVVNKQVKKVIASHIGLNPETGRQMNNKEIEVELVPQGTLAEQIRCGGAGIGGFLTETGIGTIVEEGKEKIRVGDKEYLLELPLRADLALIGASIIDKKGNVFYRGSTRNFNPLIATAADIVIAGAEKIVEVGEIDPNHVMTPGIFVDYIVEEVQ
jgi:acetate CoA/acetoacetate CoA-transferase alpha subunit